MLWAIGLIGTFYLMTLVLGFGAAALVDTGPDSEVASVRRQPRPRRCSPRRSAAVTGPTGGAVLLALIAAVAFATILAVVAGLTLTSSSSRGARPLRQRDQEGPGDREARRSGWPGSRRS